MDIIQTQPVFKKKKKKKILNLSHSPSLTLSLPLLSPHRHSHSLRALKSTALLTVTLFVFSLFSMVKLLNPIAIMDNQKKKKKTKSSRPKAKSMKVSEPPKPNPFENIWSWRKFNILGKKWKGEERRIGLARSLSIQKRKQTLLKEHKQSTKSSVFSASQIR